MKPKHKLLNPLTRYCIITAFKPVQILMLTAIIVICSVINAHGQNSIGTYLRSCTSTANTLDFDLFIRNTSGNSSMILQSGAYGIDWDYVGTGSGTVDLLYLGGSQLSPGQSSFNSINASIDTVTHSIRLNAQVVTNPAGGTPMPINTDIKVGTFRLKKTSGNWVAGSTPNFIFNLVNTSHKTTTKYFVYMNGSSLATAAVLSPAPLVESPCVAILLNNVACTTPPVARAGGPYSSCGNVILNGLLSGSATIGTWFSPTGGTFHPNSTTLNATYIPSSFDLSNGSVILSLISDNPNGLPCVPDSDNAIITFFGCNDNNPCTNDKCEFTGICTFTPINTSDNNICTTDACDPITGIITHTPVNTNDNNACTTDACNPTTGAITHTPVNTNDSNACTTDGCNTVTGIFHNPINTSDNNACTTDACNPTTGAITHTPVNTNDNNVCTTDGCDPLTGIFHTSVNTSDNNACTTDACNPTTGVITHTAINTDDGNPCTTDGCDPVTGIFHTPIGGTPPAQPGTIKVTGGSAKVCPGDVRTYTVPLVAGVTWTWTPPAGAVINSGQGTRIVVIAYTAGFTANDTLRVVAVQGCGISAQRKLLIARNLPATPSAITGSNFSVCNLTAVPYSVTNVIGISYSWSFTVASAVIAAGQGTNAITANYSTSYVTGSIRVTATNACATSAFRTLSVKATPSTATAIAGSNSVCANQQAVPYSIAPLGGATSYVWAGPTGSHIVANAIVSPLNTITTTATSVTVNFGATAGSVRVSGKNTCGTGSAKSLVVAFTCKDNQLNNESIFNAAVYPNPTSGSFSIQLFNKTPEPVILQLTDITGRVIETIKTNDELITWSQLDLSVGFYMLRIQHEDTVLVKQLTVVK